MMNAPDSNDPTLIRRANVLASIWQQFSDNDDEEVRNVLSKLFNEVKNGSVADSTDIWDWIESDDYHFGHQEEIIQGTSSLSEKDALFGIRLRQLMIEKNVTQRSLSQKLKDHGVYVNTCTISKWTSRNTYNRGPLVRNKSKILKALSEIFEVSVEYLGGCHEGIHKERMD